MNNVLFYGMAIAGSVFAIAGMEIMRSHEEQQSALAAVEPLLTDPEYHSVSDQVPCTDALMSEEWMFLQSNDAEMVACSDSGGCSVPAEERQGHTFFVHKTDNKLVLAQMNSYIRGVNVSCVQEVFDK